MKSDLKIREFKTAPVIGTKTSMEIKCFFGSKLIDIEDDIYVNNISIQYSEVVDKINVQNDHYQYYGNNITQFETNILRSLNDVKFQNHSIDIYSQKDTSSNFEWIIVINAKNILTEYLFLKLKESRVFRCIKNTDLIEKNVNDYIIDYIEKNLLNRYNISEIVFYAKYTDVVNKLNVFDKNQVLKNPNFNANIFLESNRIKNINIITPDYLNNLADVKVIYNQIKPNKQYNFNYYFTISYHKI